MSAGRRPLGQLPRSTPSTPDNSVKCIVTETRLLTARFSLFRVKMPVHIRVSDFRLLHRRMMFIARRVICTD
jgi:hypothetical protein